MSERRIAQVSALLEQRLGEILLREFEVPPGILLTITKVQTSSDRDHAEVWVSVYPESQAAETFEQLKKKRGLLQHLLHQELIMEHPPEIHWHLDIGEIKAAEVEALIDSVSDVK